MIDLALQLLFNSALLISAVVGIFALMRARDKFHSRRRAIAVGIGLVLAASVVGGSIWAATDPRSRVCRTLEARVWDPESTTEANRESTLRTAAKCRVERTSITRAHQLTVLVLLGIAGVQGFRRQGRVASHFA